MGLGVSTGAQACSMAWHGQLVAPHPPFTICDALQGYTIPLDKRLAADGRGLQQTVINDKFAGEQWRTRRAAAHASCPDLSSMLMCTASSGSPACMP